MKPGYFTSFFIGLLIFVSACNRDKKPLLPNVTGKAGEVVIVINDNVWESKPGKFLTESLGRDTEVLAHSEPMFDLVNIPWNTFTNIFKTHRNLILVSVNASEPKAKMTVRRNVWAKPQTAIEIIAPSDSLLTVFLESQTEKIINHFLIAERNRITDNYRKYEKSEIGEKLWKNHHLSLVIPVGYSLDVDSGRFVWITNETPKTSQGIFVYYYDYQGEKYLTEDFLVDKRNQVLRAHVPGPTPKSYMTTELNVYTLFQEYLKKEKYYAELRGLWKVENDFMGGPFVSLTTFDEKRNRVITVEGYVYAPNAKKRNLLRQVEAILHTLEIENAP